MTDINHVKQWRFYRTSTGAEVAKEELAALPLHAKAEMASLMKRLARGDTIFTRETENLGGGVWALRVSLSHNEFRCYYFREGNFQHVLVATHFMAKKDQKIPKRVLQLVESRRADWRSRPTRS